MTAADNDIRLNEVRKGTYLDSVALMRMSRAVAALPGVLECGMMMATPANKRIMADAGVLDMTGEAAGPADLVIAVRARNRAAADAGLAAARQSLDAPKAAAGDAATWRPRTLRAAASADPQATLALISVPGPFAAAEARKALHRGLNVMLFSDNVSLADEIALKREARTKGLLVMGPDCGTAIFNGIPLAFANVVPSGDVGIVGASGTGIQEVSCLLANHGRGISHAIGTGGRDLKHEVGGITTLMGIDLLDADPATRHIVIISKPPAPDVAAAVLARIARSRKPFTVCFIGATRAADLTVPANATLVATLSAAAEHALGRSLDNRHTTPATPGAMGKHVRGLFAGGTLCAEAQVVALGAGLAVASNVAIPGATSLDKKMPTSHVLLDLGDDEYTLGRPHPMIEPSVRDEPLREALADRSVGAIILDIVLGFGASANPAGHLVRSLPPATQRATPLFVSIVGTRGDPQGLEAQKAQLASAGIQAYASNAAATRAALRAVGVTV
jgi:FdrA protein